MDEPSFDRAGDSLLLVEDNALHVRLVRSMLDDVWYSVGKLVHVTELAHALAFLETERPGAILLDLHLPDADGLEGLDRIRAVASDVPVVVLSAHDEEATALEAIRRGAQDYLVKGVVDAASLVRAVRFAVVRDAALPRRRTSGHAGCLVFDIEGCVVRADETFARMIGVSLVEVIDADGADWFHGEELEDWRRLLKGAEQHPDGRASGSFTFRANPESAVELAVDVRLVCDAEGAPGGYVVSTAPVGAG